MPDRDYMYRPGQFANPFTRAVKWLLIVNVAVFLAQRLLARWVDLGDWFAVHPAHLKRFFAWELVTYMFLHGNVFHLLFNMLGLFIFGRDIEVKLGTRRFVFFYLTAGVFAGLAFCAWSLLGGRTVAAVGASGALMAILIMYAILWPRRKFLLFFVLPMEAWLLVLIIVILDLSAAMNASGGGVAHLGGAAYGFLFLRYCPRFERWLASISSRLEKRESESAENDQDELDRILDKVHEEGLHRLTRGEKKFLTNVSRKLSRR